MYMTREEYLLKVLYDHNKPKSKQTGSPEKYPQGFFNAMGQNHSGCLVVDHNHETGKVRGLLCHNCNRALGLFKDNPSVLQKTFEYLKV